MRKHSKVEQAVGLDVGKKWTSVCVIAMGSGEEIEMGRIRTSPEAFRQRFEGVEPVRIALEVGTDSPWISRLLEQLGHQVLVANAQKVALIYRNLSKHDRRDAQVLARLARFDPKLLHPLRHRSEQAQKDLAVIRSRHQLVQMRTRLISHVRGSVKALGPRLASCSAETFARRMTKQIPEGLKPALDPILEQIDHLTAQIRAFDRHIEHLAERYEVTQVLRQIHGVGALTALSFVLVLEDPTRFARSRSVGPYLGLVPKLDKSGDSNPSLRITRAGDRLLRKLLVQCAHFIVGPFGKDCDLRRYGERIRGQSGGHAKKKATIAVARKLAVLLHHLWVTGEVYDPLYNARRRGEVGEVLEQEVA